MREVHRMPWWWALGGFGALLVIGAVQPLPPTARIIAVAYLVTLAVLLSTGLRRAGAERFGPANAVTAARAVLVGLITALVASGSPAPMPLLVGLAAVALALDGVDGLVARLTGTSSALGASFDMHVDAFLLLVLSVHVGAFLGGWVLAIGLMLYAFVAAGLMLPWLRRPLPPRYWRKVVAASCGIALVVAASRLLPDPASALIVGAALALLVESFGRDVIWLVRVNRADRGHVTPTKASHAQESR